MVLQLAPPVQEKLRVWLAEHLKQVQKREWPFRNGVLNQEFLDIRGFLPESLLMDVEVSCDGFALEQVLSYGHLKQGMFGLLQEIPQVVWPFRDCLKECSDLGQDSAITSYGSLNQVLELLRVG
jgi:hypothetical protein